MQRFPDPSNLLQENYAKAQKEGIKYERTNPEMKFPHRLLASNYSRFIGETGTLATIHSKKHTLPALTFSSRSLKAQLISWRWLWVFLDWDWCFVLIYIYTYIDIYICPLQSWTTKASSHRGWLAQHRKQLISNTKDFMAWMKVEKSGKIPKLSLLPFALLCSELQKEQWWCPEISRHAIKMRDFSSSSYSYLNWITGCVATGKLQTPNEALPGRYAPGLFMELTQRVLLILGWTSFCSNPWQDGSVPWR